MRRDETLGCIRSAGVLKKKSLHGNTEEYRSAADEQQRQHVRIHAEILRAAPEESGQALCALGDGEDHHRSRHGEVLLPRESFGKGSEEFACFFLSFFLDFWDLPRKPEDRNAANRVFPLSRGVSLNATR